MALYRHLRIKWSIFNKLLLLVDQRIRYGTPGLAPLLRRRRELLLGFSELLRARGFVRGRYSPEVLLPSTLDTRAQFQRWKQYVQGITCSRLLVETQRRRRDGRIMYIAFKSWKMGIGSYRITVPTTATTATTRESPAGYSSWEKASEDGAAVREDRMLWDKRQTFVERRANADLRVARRTVLAAWRGSMTREIWLRQMREDRRMKKAARMEPT